MIKVTTIRLSFARMFFPPRPFETGLMEKAFLEDYARQFVGDRRAAIALGWATHTVYFGWDFLNAFHDSHEGHWLPAVLRLRGAGTVLLLIMMVIAFRKLFENERKATVVLVLGVDFIFATLLLMMIAMPFPLNYQSYMNGPTLTVFFMFGLLRLRSKIAFYNGIFCTIGAMVAFQFLDIGEVGAAWYLPNFYAFAADFSLISFMVAGYAITVELERTARITFARQRDLQGANRRLEESHDDIQTKKAALESRTAALVMAKEDLRLESERRNQDKSKFLSDAAHDLRNIMHGLSLNLEVAHISAERGDFQQSHQYVKVAKEAILVNSTSLDYILDISRLESGFVRANITNIDLELLVEEVTSQFQWSAQEQDVEIRTRRRRGSPVIVRSDRDLLGRILSNLISNGIKYRDPKKGTPASILVAVTGPVTRPRIDVVDNGIGIARTHWEDIFKPFFQLNNPERNRQRGQGLGLSIVSAIMPLLGGHSIQMNSIAGKGTRFSIAVPRSEGLVADVALGAEAPSLVLTDLAGVYILYVEDDELVRKSTEALFTAHGLLYKMVGSVEELEQQLHHLERMPDVIVTDYRLPNGFNAGDVIRLVRGEFDSLIPAIVVTGEASDLVNEPWAGLKTRILRKPVKSDAILWEISRLVIKVDLYQASE